MRKMTVSVAMRPGARKTAIVRRNGPFQLREGVVPDKRVRGVAGRHLLLPTWKMVGFLAEAVAMIATWAPMVLLSAIAATLAMARSMRSTLRCLHEVSVVVQREREGVAESRREGRREGRREAAVEAVGVEAEAAVGVR